MPASRMLLVLPSWTAMGVLARMTFSRTRLPAVAGVEDPATRSVRMPTAVLVMVLSRKVAEPTVRGVALLLDRSRPMEQLFMLMDL